MERWTSARSHRTPTNLPCAHLCWQRMVSGDRMVLSTSQAVCGVGRNLCHTLGMKMDTSAPSSKGFRFAQEIIAHAVWLYFRFNLSYRDVEELLAAWG